MRVRVFVDGEISAARRLGKFFQLCRFARRKLKNCRRKTAQTKVLDKCGVGCYNTPYSQAAGYVVNPGGMKVPPFFIKEA